LALVPKYYLLPSILVFCGIGAYALGQNTFDLWVLIIFGFVGYLMRLGKFPLGPFIIAYILAPMAEREFRAGMTAFQGDLMPLIDRPISLTLIIITVLVALFPLYGKIFRLLKRAFVRAG
jgi:putative tricarboxylic transport membrane protein